jgi:hypothetical protein
MFLPEGQIWLQRGGEELTDAVKLSLSFNDSNAVQADALAADQTWRQRTDRVAWLGARLHAELTGQSMCMHMICRS